MDKAAVAKAFNQWMHDYTQDPAAFEAIEKTAQTFLDEKQASQVPTYGEHCVAILAAYIEQQ